eukprot:4148899-Prymnesium_polylepis.1
MTTHARLAYDSALVQSSHFGTDLNDLLLNNCRLHHRSKSALVQSPPFPAQFADLNDLHPHPPSHNHLGLSSYLAIAISRTVPLSQHSDTIWSIVAALHGENISTRTFVS